MLHSNIKYISMKEPGSFIISKRKNKFINYFKGFHFKTGKLRVLVATDLLSRGIDIAFLPYVINYELPRSPKDFVHRIGRTGRAGASGVAISFCDAEEKLELRDIHKLIGKQIPLVTEHPYPMSKAELDAPPIKRVQKQFSRPQSSHSKPGQSKASGSSYGEKKSGNTFGGNKKKSNWGGKKSF